MGSSCLCDAGGVEKVPGFCKNAVGLKNRLRFIEIMPCRVRNPQVAKKSNHFSDDMCVRKILLGRQCVRRTRAVGRKPFGNEIVRFHASFLFDIFLGIDEASVLLHGEMQVGAHAGLGSGRAHIAHDVAGLYLLALTDGGIFQYLILGCRLYATLRQHGVEIESVV